MSTKRPYKDLVVGKELYNGGVKIQWVGPRKPNEKYAAYVRFETSWGEYLGSLSDRQAKALMKRLNTYFGEK